MARMALVLGHVTVWMSVGHCSAEDEDLNLITLRDLPQVHSVTVTPAKNPTIQIVHILNWHHAPKSAYAVYLRSIGDEYDLDEEYQQNCDTTEFVQSELTDLLRALVNEHDVHTVFIERSNEGVRRLELIVELLKNEPQDHPMRAVVRHDYGAVGHLLQTGELREVLPIEEYEAKRAACLISADGKYRIDPEAMERREDAIVKNLLNVEAMSVVVLGGAHDLTDNLGRLAGGCCRYIRVETNAYHEASQTVRHRGGK
jgi:hypothetical protein